MKQYQEQSSHEDEEISKNIEYKAEHLSISNVSESISVDDQVMLLKATLHKLMTIFDSEQDKMDFILDICNEYKEQVIIHSR